MKLDGGGNDPAMPAALLRLLAGWMKEGKKMGVLDLDEIERREACNVSLPGRGEGDWTGERRM